MVKVANCKQCQGHAILRGKHELCKRCNQTYTGKVTEA